MPLKPGKKAVGGNIKELMSSGRGQKQSEAIALQKAGMGKKKGKKK